MMANPDWTQAQFIETVDVCQLNRLRWPFMRLLTHAFVEEQELRRYEGELLASGRWALVRTVPHIDDGAAPHPQAHMFDVYGWAV